LATPVLAQEDPSKAEANKAEQQKKKETEERRRRPNHGSVSVITTHALFALKVQRKLSNGIAGFAARRIIFRSREAPSQRSMTNACARTPAKILAPARAASGQCRSSNANSLWWQVSAQPTEDITTFQIHGSRTDI
jgi:hypothetical protein